MAKPTTDRVITALFGTFLILLAVMTLVTAEDSARVGAVVVAAVLGLLGFDALISAARDQRSIISRIGPLP